MGVKHWVRGWPSRKPERKSRSRRPGVEVLEDRLAPAVDMWTGANFAVDENWSDGANWALRRAPTSSDAALFTNNSSVKSFTSVVDQSFTVAGLQIDGIWRGTINVPATLTLAAGSSNEWDSGSLNPTQGGGSVVNNGTLTLNSAGGVILGGGGTLQNNGIIKQTGTGDLELNGNGEVATTLVNAAGATYEFQADSGISAFFANAVNNAIVNDGLIEKTSGTGTSAITQPLTNNGGTLEVTTGILGIHTNCTNTNGTYQVAAGTTLDLTGGSTFAETGAFTAAGAGIITVGGGTFSVYNNSATLNIPSTVAFQWPGGAVNVPTNDTLTVNGNLNFDGSNNETLEGGGTLTENGTITQSGTGSLVMNGNTVATTLVIPRGSIYDFAANSGIVSGFSAAGVVNNAGTIEKTAGAASSVINVAFNNMGGALSVTTGTLSLDSTGGENSGGIFNVASGAVLDLTGGQTVNYTGTYTGSGIGEVLLGSGTLSVTGGTNGATFNLPGNLFVWAGGTISTNAANNLTVLGSMTITGAGTEHLQGGGTLNIGTAAIAGTVNDTGTGNTLSVGAGSMLAIAANGILNIADDTIGGPGLISNLGSLIKTAGTGGATISTALDNQGKVQVNDGTLLLSGAVDQVFSGVLTGGSWIAVGSTTMAATLAISSASFTTIGLGASVTLSGPNSAFSNLGSLTTNRGTFNLLGDQSFATAGNFTNAGSLTLSPGSVLTVNGNFAETSTGTDNVQMGGTTLKRTIGSITATGTVSLAGSLNVTSTITAPIGASFQILNNTSKLAVSGTFAGLPQGGTFKVKVGSTVMTFRINYKGGTGNDVVITRVA